MGLAKELSMAENPDTQQSKFIDHFGPINPERKSPPPIYMVRSLARNFIKGVSQEILNLFSPRLINRIKGVTLGKIRPDSDVRRDVAKAGYIAIHLFRVFDADYKVLSACKFEFICV